MTALANTPEPEVLIEEARERHRSRVRRIRITLASIAVAGLGALAIIVPGHAHVAHSSAAAHPLAVGLLTGECRSLVRDRVVPVWARDGFSQPRPRMPYTLGARGEIAALGGVSLYSPPRADHNNKIVWVPRIQSKRAHILRISAQRMNGTQRLGRPVRRVVDPGPGPSIVNLPAPGCWRLTLRWAGQTDQLDLRYSSPDTQQ